MDITLKQLPHSMAELTITLSPADYQKFLISAAQKISATSAVDGFRPGFAPYEIIVKKFGSETILEKALPDIITHTFVAAIQEKQLTTLGQPEINVKKMAPDNDLIYTAQVALVPTITLPDLSPLSLAQPTVTVTAEEIEKFLIQLAKSRATEILESRPAQNNDLVKLDYQIALAGVPQEGATQKNFSVFLGEHHMVPGFEEQLLDLSAGDQKKFSLTFPNDYFQKNFAGKECEFTVNLQGVYRLDIPAIDDALAQGLGQFENLAALKKQIADNLQAEKQLTADRQLENDLLKLVIDKISFPELPDQLIANEQHLMLHELEDDLAAKGLSLSTWLTNLDKTEEQLEKDLQPQAELRAKSILAIRAIIQEQKITAEEKEIDLELQKIASLYADDPESKTHFQSRDYRDYLTQSLINKKAVAWLKEKIVK